MDGVGALVRNKSFITTLVGLIVALLVAAVPALQEQQETLIIAIVALVGVAIGGYTVQDWTLATGQARVAEANAQMARWEAEGQAAQTAMLEAQSTNLEHVVEVSPPAYLPRNRNPHLDALLVFEELTTPEKPGDPVPDVAAMRERARQNITAIARYQ